MPLAFVSIVLLAILHVLRTGRDMRCALEEYATLARYYPGAEARVLEALLHKKLGHAEKAEELFTAIPSDARLAPWHFQRSQREWIDIAKREQS